MRDATNLFRTITGTVLLAASVVACTSRPKVIEPPIVHPIPPQLSQVGRFSPEGGFEYEALNVRLGETVLRDGPLWETVRNVKADGTDAIPKASGPDIEVEAFSLGEPEGHGDTYKLWLGEGLLGQFPRADGQLDASLNPTLPKFYKIDAESLKQIRQQTAEHLKSPAQANAPETS